MAATDRFSLIVVHLECCWVRKNEVYLFGLCDFVVVGELNTPAQNQHTLQGVF